MKNDKESDSWKLLRSTLTKSQWRDIRRKKDPFIVFDLNLPFTFEQLGMLERDGFEVRNVGYMGGAYTTITPPQSRIKTSLQ